MLLLLIAWERLDIGIRIVHILAKTVALEFPLCFAFVMSGQHCQAG
jgi:hypothetical protein